MKHIFQGDGEAEEIAHVKSDWRDHKPPVVWNGQCKEWVRGHLDRYQPTQGLLSREAFYFEGNGEWFSDPVTKISHIYKMRLEKTIPPMHSHALPPTVQSFPQRTLELNWTKFPFVSWGNWGLMWENNFPKETPYVSNKGKARTGAPDLYRAEMKHLPLESQIHNELCTSTAVWIMHY